MYGGSVYPLALHNWDWSRSLWLLGCLSLFAGCASEALSLENPTIRSVQINPNVLSIQQERYTLDFTINFSESEREMISLSGLSAPNLGDIGLQVEEFEIHSNFEFSIDVSVLPNPQFSLEPQVLRVVVDTKDGHSYILEGFITLLSL